MKLIVQPLLKSSLNTNTVITGGACPNPPSTPIFTIQGAGDFTNPPVDGEFLQWDGDTQKFVMASVSAPDLSGYVDTTSDQTISGTKTFESLYFNNIEEVQSGLGLGDMAYIDSPVPVANGGTGVSNLTSGRVLFGNGTSALSTNANLTFNSGTNNFALNGHEVITNQVAGTIPLRIHGAASQSALLTDWRNSSNTSVASVGAAGAITGASLTSSSTIAGVSQTITNTTASTVPLSVKHASTPSVDFFNVLDSANAKVFAVSSDKTLLLPPASSNGSNQSLTWKTDGTQWGNAELHVQRNTSTNNGLGTQLKLTDNGVSAYIKFISRSFTQAINDLEFWSQGGLNISMPYSGGTYIYQPVQNTQSPALLTAPAQTVYPGGGTASPQGAFIFEGITWAATSATSIADVAGLLVKSAPIVGVNMTITRRYSGLLYTNSATAVGVGVRGHASQSANLQQWEDSSANTLAAIKSNGAIQPATLADADAANGTLYYSTTASKLVFKDGSGVVNNLY